MKETLTILALIAALGFAGESDYEAAKLQEQTYCQMVKDGKWPAYNPDITCQK